MTQYVVEAIYIAHLYIFGPTMNSTAAAYAVSLNYFMLKESNIAE